MNRDALDDLNQRSHEFACGLTPEVRIRFTGWKPSQMSSGVVAQWCDYRRVPYFYVNMPGMTGGPYESGATFDISGPRLEVADFENDDKVHGLIETGLNRLLALSNV